MDLASYIRDVPDFPKEGIVFKDITTLLQEPKAFQSAVDQMVAPFRGKGISAVVGIESRGFIFGSAMALTLETSFVPVRKPGKLPAETVSESYELEYGTDTIEIHQDAIEPGASVLMVDDLLATGGTMAAAVRLVKKLGGIVLGATFLIELDFLKGRDQLPGVPVHSLIHCDSE